MFATMLLALTVMITVTSCHQASPSGGQECVLIMQPLLFGHGGVDPVPVTTGAEWCAKSTEFKMFNITPVTIEEPFTDIPALDNQPVSFSCFLKLRCIPGKTPILMQNFSADWYQHSVQQTFRTMVANNIPLYKMLTLTSKRDTAILMEKKLKEDIKKYVADLQMPVEILDVSFGKILPPQSVLDQTKLTAAQNQSKLTQAARADSETSRKQAEINKAEADKAYINAMGMNIFQYIELRNVEIEKEKIELAFNKENSSRVTVILSNLHPYMNVNSK